jgi:hypothetical protein
MSIGCACWVTAPDDTRVAILRKDVLNLHTDLQADVVLSVGLIEHFSPSDTRRPVLAHFDLLPLGRCTIQSFPALSPYATSGRNARSIEISGRRKRVAGRRERGDRVHGEVPWPLILTPQLIVAQKHA